MIRGITSTAKSVAKHRLGPALASRQPRRVDLPHERWSLRIGADGTLAHGSLDLVELTHLHGSPLHIVDGDALRRAAADALAPLARGVPAADIFYSYKTNPVPGVLSRLHAEGIGAEVISPFELWLAMRLGVPGSRIIYNGPAKSEDSIRTAIDIGACVINANSAGEVAVIRRLATEGETRPRVGLRVSLPSTWGGQFGIDARSTVLPELVGSLQGDLAVDFIGLHVHRGFPHRTSGDFESYLHGVLSLCDDIRGATGWSPSLLDLGGSLTCPTVAQLPARQFRLNRALGTDLLPPDPSVAISIAEASTVAGSVVSEHFDAAGVPTPRIVLEPGRALTGSAQMLLLTVLDVKDDGLLAHAILDGGINIAEPTTHEYHQLFSVSRPADAHDRTYRLAGPICTPADVIVNSWRLPALEPGHVLAIMDAGAYFVPFSTSFSFPRPAIVAIEAGEVRPLRLAETFGDIVSNDVGIHGGATDN